MSGKVGDRISLDSKKAGQPRREGEILEVFESVAGVRYQVRWADGHESDIRPSAGSVSIIPAATRRKRTAVPAAPTKKRAAVPAATTKKRTAVAAATTKKRTGS